MEVRARPPFSKNRFSHSLRHHGETDFDVFEKSPLTNKRTRNEKKKKKKKKKFGAKETTGSNAICMFCVSLKFEEKKVNSEPTSIVVGGW